MENKIYYCESCGGVMEFDVGTQSLKCPHCDTVVPIINDTERIVEHRLTTHAVQTIRAEEKATHTMECKGCGAKIEVDATSTATECPYCGSSYVLAGKQEDAIVPDGVLPFQVDKNRVGELFRQWMKGRWLAPGELKHLYQQERLQGIYIPYWTFDAKGSGWYSAMGGRHRVVTRTVNGKTERRTVTDWYPTSGSVRRSFDDILVPASNKLKEGLLKQVGSFGTQQMASYAPEYFSGYGAECYTVDLQDAHQEALRRMNEELEDMARSDVLRRYDEVRNVNLRASYEDETYKHVMMPIYTTAYTYKGKQYHVLINGQSGQVKGDYPKSPVKIALIVAAVLLVLLMIFGISGGRRMRAVPVIGQTEVYGETEIAALDQPAEIDWAEEEAVWDCSADNLPM